MSEIKIFDIIAQTYYEGVEVKVEPSCNGFIAINNGDTLVRVCGIPLKPYPPGHPELTGAAIAVPGNIGELYKGRIWIVFDPAPGLDPNVCIIQKYYK